MKRVQTDRTLLALSIAGFFFMSASFLVMPFSALGFLPGILFWGGLLIGGALQIALEVRRRAFFASYHVKCKSMQNPRNGLVSFAANTPAKIADCALLGSLLATAVAFILTGGTGYVCYILIAATVMAFCLHCILNGRIYFHSKNQPVVQRVLEERNLKKEGETDK